MKKRIVMGTLVLLMGMSSVLANKSEGINERVLNSFKKEFVDAREVSWETTSQYIKVSFSLNAQAYVAFYGQDGERIAIARNLTSFELPMSLSTDLKKSYGNYWITDLFEIHSKEETAYYVTVENADQKITLRSAGLNEWSVYKRTDKK